MYRRFFVSNERLEGKFDGFGGLLHGWQVERVRSR